MPDHVSIGRCIAALVPQAAIDAAARAAATPTHDDGHTDCYYAGLLLAAWPHLNANAPVAECEGCGVGLTAARAENAREQAGDHEGFVLCGACRDYARLDAENGRLRAALEKIADGDDNGVAVAIACSALNGENERT